MRYVLRFIYFYILIASLYTTICSNFFPWIYLFTLVGDHLNIDRKHFMNTYMTSGVFVSTIFHQSLKLLKRLNFIPLSKHRLHKKFSYCNFWLVSPKLHLGRKEKLTVSRKKTNRTSYIKRIRKILDLKIRNTGCQETVKNAFWNLEDNILNHKLYTQLKHQLHVKINWKHFQASKFLQWYFLNTL